MIRNFLFFNVICILLLWNSSLLSGQIVGNIGGPYMVIVGESVQLNGDAVIPGDHLRQIGLALFNFDATFNNFPAAFVTDVNDVPLFSWRVSILPFLGEIDLYNQFDRTKAWDDPVNLPLLDSIPDVYRRIGSLETDHLTDFAGAFREFVMLSGQNALFEGGTNMISGSGTVRFADINRWIIINTQCQ